MLEAPSITAGSVNSEQWSLVPQSREWYGCACFQAGKIGRRGRGGGGGAKVLKQVDLRDAYGRDAETWQLVRGQVG